jgi:hypothetical protein
MLTFHSKSAIIELNLEKDKADWWIGQLEALSKNLLSLEKIHQEYGKQFSDFDAFWQSEAIADLRDNGLLVL